MLVWIKTEGVFMLLMEITSIIKIKKGRICK